MTNFKNKIIRFYNIKSTIGGTIFKMESDIILQVNDSDDLDTIIKKARLYAISNKKSIVFSSFRVLGSNDDDLFCYAPITDYIELDYDKLNKLVG